MSITLSYDVLCKLSPPCRDEILMALRNSWAYPDVVDELEATETAISISQPNSFDMTVSTGSAFESASLSFSTPLILPAAASAVTPTATLSSNSALCPHLLALAACNCAGKQPKQPPAQAAAPVTKKVRFAPEAAPALPSDIYTARTPAEIEEIITDIDTGLFVGPDSWLSGKKHHPRHYDVRKVLMVINKHPSGVNSYTINMALLSMCRTRVAAILRQLKIQGIIVAKPVLKV
jgi:hypothetical protein